MGPLRRRRRGPRPSPIGWTRRQWLQRATCGFGSLALTGLQWDELLSGAPAANGGAHHAPRARSVIYLYMDGGPSSVDTFDPKPRLTAEDGKPFGMKKERTQFNNNGDTLGSLWKFAKHGESGIEVSELFPHVATCVDDLAVVRSMVSDFSEHTNANYFLHTGHGLQGRPSMGAWIGYGLGAANRDLPMYVVVNGGLTPPGGLDNFGSGFLPATFQASRFRPSQPAVANLGSTPDTRKLALVEHLDRLHLAEHGREGALESAIHNQELAARMQTAVPELTDLATESKATHRLYGTDSDNEPTRIYARQCMLARRLVERGVRFVELTCPHVGADRWDQHSDLKGGHERNARAVDQPIAGLIKDLKCRGLLDETLIVWGGEFGRTPFAQGRNGRDHNPYGFTKWLAGGGVRGGTVWGETDEYGYKAVRDPVSIHDLHATILHLLGIDHERLTYRFSGRDIRLTDVYGSVVRGILHAGP